MVHGSLPSRTPPSTLIPGRALAEQVFSRAAGAPLIGGNSIRLLIDADFVGMSPYVQALRSAAMDGVDIRLLVPGSTDIPVLRAVSRSGYQPLLEAGVRVFEWNGPMMHAKTAVADGLRARVGSTNLNIASWMGNFELDVAVEDAMQGKESAGILDAIPQPWHPPGLKGSFGFYSFASWAIYSIQNCFFMAFYMSGASFNANPFYRNPPEDM